MTRGGPPCASTLTQDIAAPVDEVAAAYASPELYDADRGRPPSSVRPRCSTAPRPTGRVTLRVRYRFIGDLSPAVTAVVDPARLTWVEESVHDLDGLSVGASPSDPDHYADRLRCPGTYRLPEPAATGPSAASTGDLQGARPCWWPARSSGRSSPGWRSTSSAEAAAGRGATWLG